MSATGLEVVDKTIQETNHLLKIIETELGIDDRRLAFGALRATLHALRDRLEAYSAIHFAAQLPMLVRGLFYEGWQPAKGPSRERHAADFLDHVATELPPALRAHAKESCAAALAALRERMDEGEIEKVLAQLPSELRQLWPDRNERGAGRSTG
jgi:uncharacterized protein (DUF2267 family)